MNEYYNILNHTQWNAMLAVNQHTGTGTFEVQALLQDLCTVCDILIQTSLLDYPSHGRWPYDYDLQHESNPRSRGRRGT